MDARTRLVASVGAGSVLLGLVFATSVRSQPREILKIASVRGTPSGGSLELTEYILPDRRREEAQGLGGERIVEITRCDRDSYSTLNVDRGSYSTASLLTMRREAARPPDPSDRKKPILLIEIATVDTGERRTTFGYTARHAITTQKETVSGSTAVTSAELRSDGWYIDLDTETTCAMRAALDGQPGRALPVLSGQTMVGNLYEPVLTYVGARETGYPLEEHRTYRRTLTTDDGGSRQDVSDWSFRVTSLSFQPYDASLFEIPAHFRLQAMLRSAWEWVQRVAARL